MWRAATGCCGLSSARRDTLSARSARGFLNSRAAASWLQERAPLSHSGRGVGEGARSGGDVAGLWLGGRGGVGYWRIRLSRLLGEWRAKVDALAALALPLPQRAVVGWRDERAPDA